MILNGNISQPHLFRHTHIRFPSAFPLYSYNSYMLKELQILNLVNDIHLIAVMSSVSHVMYKLPFVILTLVKYCATKLTFASHLAIRKLKHLCGKAIVGKVFIMNFMVR